MNLQLLKHLNELLKPTKNATVYLHIKEGKRTLLYCCK